VAERRDISALKSLTQELRFPNSTSEITLLILRFASDIFQRGVLFMVGEDELTGLGQFGLEIERADERIRETVLSYGESPFLKRIIEEMQSYKGRLEKDAITEGMIRELGGGWPLEVIFFPVITEGKVVALLYADNALTGDPFSETEGLEIFISQAGLALEKSLLQRKLQELQKAGGKTSAKRD
jgi:GAF domain-containing protein